jgi:hypothetical protein
MPLILPIGPQNPSDDTMLDQIQQESFPYFLHESNLENGLVRDKNKKDWPASITATGLALACYPIGVERCFLTRDDAIKRTLATLRFFSHSQQGTEASSTGYRGFYYHFLDMQTGRRAWKSELSTIDSAFLLAGVLTAAVYFDRDTREERELREHADALYRRADWQWAQDGGLTLSQGWKPETGFLRNRWQGYSEALLLYVLGLGSPTYPLMGESYPAWNSTYKWKKIYDIEYLYGGPLFIHQYSHLWLDFRGIQDVFMRKKGIDYFENSRRATLIQQRYAIRNPRRFAHYGEHCWGITACDGPGPTTARVDGIERKFFDYAARGVPFGPDDGTVAPWAVVASLPFVPEIVLPTIRHLNELRLREGNPYSFRATFNPTYPHQGGKPYGWVTPWHFALSQGPIVMMIENYRTGFLWNLMRRCSYIVNGLRRAGFSEGWLP